MTSLDNSLIGKTIDGKFCIERHLGTGGMGTAYEAIQKDLNRHVCLKFLKSDALSSLDSVNRFKREARVLASLQHKNIVECFSFGIYENVYPYLALEFVEGMPLNALVEKESLHWTRVVRLVIQVCEALEYAHKSGFIHRDIKPANVMITRGTDDTELVKVVDFGLVGKQQGEFVFDTLTDPRSIIGSVNYMPPEAFKGAVADVSLDVYAVGCLLYETLSGQLPFEAENPIAVMFKHTKERLPDIPVAIKPDRARHALNELIHKATEADQSARLKSCAQIREQLLEILEGQSSVPSSATESDYEPTLQQGVQQRSSHILKGKWLVPVLTATVMVLGTTIALQTNLRASVSEKNHVLPLWQQKQGASPDSKTKFDDALKQFRSSTLQLERVSGGKAKEPVNSFRAFLEQYSFALRTDDKEVQKLTEAACAKLSTLQETTQEQNMRTQLFNLRCDLLTSLGYFENTLVLLKARNSPQVPLLTKLRKGGSEELIQLDDYVLGKGGDSFLVERLRPAAAFYPDLKDDGMRFLRLVNQLNSVEWKDHWSPRLIEIAEEVSRNRDERLVQLWIELCQVAVKSDEPELARSLLPKIRKEMTRYPLASVDQVATLYDRLDKTEEALRIIQEGCEAARRRGEHFTWCLWQHTAIKILNQRGREKEARETLQRVLRSEHWTPDRYDKHHRFEWFDLVYRYSNLSFELQDYTSFLKLYNQSMKMREPKIEERCLEISVNYAGLFWQMNRDREADAVIKGEIGRATASQKLQFAGLLCDMVVHSDTVNNAKLRIRMLKESSSLLSGLLKNRGKLDTAIVDKYRNSLLNANVNLANAYLSDCQWEQAKEICLQISRGEFAKISEHAKAGWLASLLHAQRYAGEAESCRKTAAKILEVLRNISVWSEADYSTFYSATEEYVLAEAYQGDLRRAQAFIDAQLEQFNGKSPQQCYLQALSASCSIWGPGQRLDLGLAQLEKACKCLGTLPPPDDQQAEFYCVVTRAIAIKFMELGAYDRAQKLQTQFTLTYTEGHFLERIDAYCALAEFAYYRGNYDEALSALEMASTISASELDRKIRTNFLWAKILATQGHFPGALEKLDQLRKLVDREKNLDDRVRSLILIEVAYDTLYTRWKRPAEGHKHLQKALKLFESGLKSENMLLDIVVVGVLLEHLSADAERHHHIVQSTEFLQEMRNPAFLKLWRKTNFNLGTGLCYYRLAKLYRRQNQDAKALTYLRQSIRFNRPENYTLQLAEVEAAVGEEAAAARNYQAALDRAHQLACLKNPVQDFERARVYLSYACWLHDQNHSDQAKQYAGKAISLMSHNPAIYDRKIYGLGWITSESDATLRNLEKLAKWYTLEQKTVQQLIAAARSVTDL
ncbi:MAG: protein kinase [Candidatus Obscuribacterales bacterium]|nr:protein kinase [Candidatus Obscuribacterales bacterium]